jgi:hypothetical protein
MGLDSIKKESRSNKIVIHGSNYGTEEMGYLLLIWIPILMALTVFGLLFYLEYNIYSVYYTIFIFIILLWFLYYYFSSKSIYVLDQGLSGPFYELPTLIYRPFKTKFYIPYEKVQKIELHYYRKHDSYYTKIFVDEKYYQVGLKNGEAIRFQRIMEEIRPEILIEKKF